MHIRTAENGDCLDDENVKVYEATKENPLSKLLKTARGTDALNVRTLTNLMTIEFSRFTFMFSKIYQNFVFLAKTVNLERLTHLLGNHGTDSLPVIERIRMHCVIACIVPTFYLNHDLK